MVLSSGSCSKVLPSRTPGDTCGILKSKVLDLSAQMTDIVNTYRKTVLGEAPEMEMEMERLCTHPYQRHILHGSSSVPGTPTPSPTSPLSLILFFNTIWACKISFLVNCLYLYTHVGLVGSTNST
mmetsp:Transcript_8255/g.16552  ORF Transcript_8255/g.16552 Transcript_8255/m.16552 type:complete len:125 (+) Transcript_8255:66-440(+)